MVVATADDDITASHYLFNRVLNPLQPAPALLANSPPFGNRRLRWNHGVPVTAGRRKVTAAGAQTTLWGL